MEPTDKIDRLMRLRRLQELRQQRQTMVASFGLLSYRPHPKQDAFHRAGGKRLRMLRAGNRFGKSEMGCAEDCAWAMNERVWYPKNDPARTAGIPQKPNKILVITTDWEKVNEVFTSEVGGAKKGKLLQMLPASFIKRMKKGKTGVVDTIECQNGSVIRFDTVNSYKHNPQTAESVNWDAIHIDEPCPQDQWKASARGLVDTNGKAWFTLTMTCEFWINDVFFPSQVDDVTHIDLADRWAMTGGMRDNPHITEEAIAAYENDLTPDERQCRIEGLPLHLTGLVYKAFSRAEHVMLEKPGGWTDFDCPPNDYIITVAMDVHPQTEQSVLFVATNELQQHFIFDEIWAKVAPGEELVAMIKQKLYGRRLGRVYCDPIAWVEDPITKTCWADTFKTLGLPLTKATKAKTAGIMNMQGLLKRRPPFLRVSPYCKQFLWEIGRYHYDTENKPVDKDDHFMENMYRLFYRPPRWSPTQDTFSPVKDMAITSPGFTQDEFAIEFD